jgi:hypothetical protein
MLHSRAKKEKRERSLKTLPTIYYPTDILSSKGLKCSRPQINLRCRKESRKEKFEAKGTKFEIRKFEIYICNRVRNYKVRTFLKVTNM